MSFERRFELPNFNEDEFIDLSQCTHCRYSDGSCLKAGRCLQEDY